MSGLRSFRTVLKNSHTESFQSFASELFYPGIQINFGEEAEKATRNLTAYVVPARRLSTSNITLPDLNNDLPCIV